MLQLAVRPRVQNDNVSSHCAPCSVGLTLDYGVATASQLNPTAKT
jgi:hypothetical protein